MAVFACLGGIWISRTSWDGVTFYYLGDKRQPAAIQKVFDFSHLEGSALQLASQKRVLSAAKIISLSEGIGIELGHFITRGPDGKKQFACHVYNRIQLVFFAEGIADAGNKPRMEIEGECKMDTNINRISAIPIPVAKILEEKPGNFELNFLEGNPVTIHFEHVTDQWPREWSLYSVRLYDQDKRSSEVFVDHQQVQETTSGPIRVSWY